MSQKFKKYIALKDKRKFIIEEDVPEVGWYLKVYENEKCVSDYLQNTFEIACEQAQEIYQVDLSEWQEIKK